MENAKDDDKLGLRDRLECLGLGQLSADAQPRLYYCTYCTRTLRLLPFELRVCQLPSCIEAAIADLNERIFEIKLSIPGAVSQIKEKIKFVLTDIEELKKGSNQNLVLNYESILAQLKRNIFYAQSKRIDMIEQINNLIAELAKRLIRPLFPDEFRRKLWDRDGKKCYLCHKVIVTWSGESMHIEHVIPRSKGGSDKEHNLRISHPKCNLKKGDKPLTAQKNASRFTKPSKV